MSNLNTKTVLPVYDALAGKYPALLKKLPRDRVEVRLEFMKKGSLTPERVLEKALKEQRGEEILSELLTSDDPQSSSKLFDCIIRLTHQGWNLPEEGSGGSEEDLTEGNSEEDSSEDIDSLLNHIEPVEAEEKSDNEEILQGEDMSNLLEGIDPVDKQPENPPPTNREPEPSQAEKKNTINHEKIVAALKKTVINLCEERDNLRKLRKETRKPYTITIPEELDVKFREIAIELGKNNTPFTPAELKRTYDGVYDKEISRGYIGRVFYYWLTVGFVKKLIVNEKAVRGYYLLVSHEQGPTLEK